MLCRLLTATGVAGHPEAYFHRSLLSSWAGIIETPLDPTLGPVQQAKVLIDAARDKGRGSGDIFGVRLQGHGLAFFLQAIAAVCPDATTSAERIERLFGPTRILYLNRTDKIAQALFYVRAQQSGLWHKATDGTEIERLSPHRDPVYDFAQIFAVYQEMRAFDRTWRDWFKRQAIAPQVIRYEDLSADPDRTLRDILRAIDRPAGSTLPRADTARLSDALTERWRARFVEDLEKTGLG